MGDNARMIERLWSLFVFTTENHNFSCSNTNVCSPTFHRLLPISLKKLLEKQYHYKDSHKLLIGPLPTVASPEFGTTTASTDLAHPAYPSSVIQFTVRRFGIVASKSATSPNVTPVATFPVLSLICVPQPLGFVIQTLMSSSIMGGDVSSMRRQDAILLSVGSVTCG